MISEAREKMMKHASVVVVIRDDESRFLFLDFRMCNIFLESIVDLLINFKPVME